MVVNSNTFRQNEADCVPHMIINIGSVFSIQKIYNQSGDFPVGTRQKENSDSNFGPKQSVGIVGKLLKLLSLNFQPYPGSEVINL